jgi:GNAT superfamily N-acetyltransferase
MNSLNNGLIFILATKSHQEGVLLLLKSRLQESVAHHQNKPSFDYAQSSQIFDTLISNPNYYIAIGIQNNKVIACASVFCLPMVRRGGYIAFVEHVVVNKELRGQSIGTQLMKFIIQESRKRKVQTIKLFTRTNAPKIHEFYQKLGFSSSDIGMKLDIN